MVGIDSFGANCPNNWEEIADYLNEMIVESTYDVESEQERREVECDIWEAFCSGDLDGAPVPEFD